MTICSIMQPTYLPWLGYFELLNKSDIFILLDNVKLQKSSWHVRNRIKSANGELILTVPVTLVKGRLQSSIIEAKINREKPWLQKHLKSIRQCYGKTSHFDEFYPILENLISATEISLANYTSNIIRGLVSYLGISTPIIEASKIENITGYKDERLLSICRNFDATSYYSPKGSSNYLDKENYGGALEKAGVRVIYQNFSSIEYPQRYGAFIPNLSIIDALFNCGPKGTMDLIVKGGVSSHKLFRI